MSVLTLVLNIAPEVTPGATWQKEKKKGTQVGKSKTVSADSLVVYEENKEFTKKQLEMVRARLQDTRSL